MVDMVWTPLKNFKHLCVNINISMVCGKGRRHVRIERRGGSSTFLRLHAFRDKMATLAKDSFMEHSILDNGISILYQWRDPRKRCSGAICVICSLTWRYILARSCELGAIRCGEQNGKDEEEKYRCMWAIQGRDCLELEDSPMYKIMQRKLIQGRNTFEKTVDKDVHNLYYSLYSDNMEKMFFHIKWAY